MAPMPRVRPSAGSAEDSGAGRWDPLGLVENRSKERRQRLATRVRHGRLGAMEAFGLLLPDSSDELLARLSATMELSFTAGAEACLGAPVSIAIEPGAPPWDPLELMGAEPRLRRNRELGAKHGRLAAVAAFGDFLPEEDLLSITLGMCGPDHSANTDCLTVVRETRRPVAAGKNKKGTCKNIRTPPTRSKTCASHKSATSALAPPADGKATTLPVVHSRRQTSKSPLLEKSRLSHELEASLPGGQKRPMLGDLANAQKRAKVEEDEWPEEKAQCEGCQRVTFCEPYGLSSALLCSSCSNVESPALWALARECLKLQAGIFALGSET